MKLVIATPLYPPEIGGPATYAKLLEEGLGKEGFTIEVVKFSEVRHLPKFIRHCAYYRRVLKAAKGADIVYALDPVSVGLPAMLAARKAKKPFVVKIVGDYAWEQGRQRFGVTETLDDFVKVKPLSFPVRMLRRVQTYVAQNAVRVIVPSNYLKGIVATWGSPSRGSGEPSIPREKIEVIYNAVSLTEMGTVPPAVQKLSRPLIVTAGRLVPWKHFDGVIDAVADIMPASLTIVGDGPLRASLTHAAGEKLAGRSAVTGGLSHEDTLAVMKSADVFVLNSSYEGLSHMLIEACMLGVPVVTTRVGGNPEVITDGEDGLLVPAGDTTALTQAIVRMISDDEFRVRLRAHAAVSAKRFSTEVMLGAVAAMLKKIK
jgi:glycosyltransferase involved in cell wall biosynthesis